MRTIMVTDSSDSIGKGIAKLLLNDNFELF